MIVRRNLYKILFSVFLFCILNFYNEITVQAQEYPIYIYDDANVLTDEQEEQLYEHLKESLFFAQKIYVVIMDKNYKTSKDYFNAFLDGETTIMRDTRAIKVDRAGSTEAAVVFLLDLDNQKICFADYNKNYLEKRQRDAYAEIITENAYPYFQDGEYYECIYNAFGQYQKLNEGENIFMPANYIGNAMIAISISICIVFIIMRSMSIIKVQTEEERKQDIYERVDVSNAYAVYKETHVTYRKTN